MLEFFVKDIGDRRIFIKNFEKNKDFTERDTELKKEFGEEIAYIFGFDEAKNLAKL